MGNSHKLRNAPRLTLTPPNNLTPLNLIAALATATPRLGTSHVQAVSSPFLAANFNGLAEEDSNTSDGVEINNPTAATIHPEGWHLTNNDESSPEYRDTRLAHAFKPGGSITTRL